VAERLGVDVRAVAHLLDDPAFGDQTDLERAQSGYRNARALYDIERDRLHRLSKLVPGDVPPNGQRDKALGYLDAARIQSETVRRHLETVHKWAETIRSLGGGVTSNGTVVEIPVPGRVERGDLDADGYSENADDDADQ